MTMHANVVAIIIMAMDVLSQGEDATIRTRRLRLNATESAAEIETETVIVSLTESMSEPMTEIMEVTMSAGAEHPKWKRTIVKNNT